MRPACLVLFAGGGGSTLGCEAADFDCLGVEYDADACAVHNAHAGPCILADIRDHAAWIPRVVAWLAGRPLRVWASPPCQAFSSAGKRRGAQDDRNGWPWTWEAIDALRAAGVEVISVTCENVPGMLHHLSRAECDHGARPNPDACPGCYFAAVVVPELARRFAAARWTVLDAADYGVPQHRERLILHVGDEAIRWPAATHHPIGGILRPWWSTVDDALGYPVVGGGSRGHGMDEWRPGVYDDAPAPAVTGFGSTGALYVAAPCTTVTATEGRGCATDTRRASRTLGRRATPEECARLQAWPEVIPALDACRTAEARYRVVGNAVPPPLAAAIMGRLVAREAAA